MKSVRTRQRRRSRQPASWRQPELRVRPHRPLGARVGAQQNYCVLHALFLKREIMPTKEQLLRRSTVALIAAVRALLDPEFRVFQAGAPYAGSIVAQRRKADEKLDTKTDRRFGLAA